MPAPVLGQFEKPVLAWVNRIFADPQISRSITYKIYSGRDEDGEPITADVSFLGICMKDVTSLKTAEGAVIQGRFREYLLRASDLPKGVVLNDVCVNDRLIDGSGEYVVLDLDRTLGFVFKASVSGS